MPSSNDPRHRIAPSIASIIHPAHHENRMHTLIRNFYILYLIIFML